MSGRPFLSLPPRAWGLSLGIHFWVILAIFLTGRFHFFDLSQVTEDFAPSRPIALNQPPKEDIWQKPTLRKLSRLPVQKPKAAPTPAPAPSESSPVGGQGTSSFRSSAQVSQLPQFKVQIKAAYPEAAKHSGLEGVVVLRVDIDATGSVVDVEVIQGLGSGCDEAAVAAMRQSTFIPAYAGSEPVPVRIRIPYRFEINE